MTKSIIKTKEIIRLQEKKNKRSEKPVEDSSLKKSRICRPSAFKSRKLCVEIDSDEEERCRTTWIPLKVWRMVESDFWTKSERWVRNEKWGERYRETALCLFYNLKFGTLDAWRIQSILSCSEISAFGFLRCVAHPLDACASNTHLCSFYSNLHVDSRFLIHSLSWDLYSSRSSVFHVFSYVFWTLRLVAHHSQLII